MDMVCMDMDSDEVGRVNAPDYDDEVLCAGWVPTLALHQAHQKRPAMPADLAAVDVETFLRKMYACQR